jgi:hypothetical protein
MLAQHSPRLLSVLCALAFLLIVAPRAAAQDRQLLEDQSRANTISSRFVVHLSFVGLDVAPDVQAHVFRLPGGGWGVSSAVFPGVVQLFDSDGAPAGTFGRSGKGPGEFGGEVFAMPMRGELWVVDHRNLRLSIFTKDLRFVGDRRLEVKPFFIAPARDGKSLLVSGSAYTGEMYYAIARVSREPGADAFGDPLGQNPLPNSQWLVKRRRAAESAGGEVWAIAMSGGEVDVLRGGDLRITARLRLPGREMEREASWYADFNERPAPTLAGVAADSAGILWVSFFVADSDWTPGMDPRENIEQYADTKVLAVDPEKRAVVGTLQLDPLCMPVEGRLISCVDELGQTIRVVSLTLEPGRSGRP